jgi:hypothetical protein
MADPVEAMLPAFSHLCAATTLLSKLLILNCDEQQATFNTQSTEVNLGLMRNPFFSRDFYET